MTQRQAIPGNGKATEMIPAISIGNKVRFIVRSSGEVRSQLARSRIKLDDMMPFEP